MMSLYGGRENGKCASVHAGDDKLLKWSMVRNITIDGITYCCTVAHIQPRMTEIASPSRSTLLYRLYLYFIAWEHFTLCTIICTCSYTQTRSLALKPKLKFRLYLPSCFELSARITMLFTSTNKFMRLPGFHLLVFLVL